MANAGPGTLTITGTTGAGQAVTALPLSGMTEINVNVMNNTVKVTADSGSGSKITYFDYSALSTITWTISAGATSVTMS